MRIATEQNGRSLTDRTTEQNGVTGLDVLYDGPLILSRVASLGDLIRLKTAVDEVLAGRLEYLLGKLATTPADFDLSR